jgi:tRNA threonylcarbamoyl adenosine modification protein YjeE
MDPLECHVVRREMDLLSIASDFLTRWEIGNLVCLEGPLGVGKTTFVRTVLRSLGFNEPVKSPTFNLYQTFDTQPPILHADLYRVQSAVGIGLEDLLQDHLAFIEWPDRLDSAFLPRTYWMIQFEFGASETERILKLLLHSRV